MIIQGDYATPAAHAGLLNKVVYVVLSGQLGAEMQPVLSSHACPLQGCVNLEEGAISAICSPRGKGCPVSWWPSIGTQVPGGPLCK